MFKINTRNIEKTQTVYLSGPMTSLPDCNREAFNLRAEAFRAAGYTVKNPADIRVVYGTDKSYEFYFRRAVQMLLQSDVMYVFGDITHSCWAEMEMQLAKMSGIRVV